MTPSHEFLVVQSQNWIIRVQEIGVKDDFHTVVVLIVKLYSSDLTQDWVVRIIHHVMRRNWWEGISFKGIYTPFQLNLVFRRKEILHIR
jgi:hypothetical protein